MSNLSFAFFERAFKLPFIFGNQSLSQRRGFLIKRESGAGVFFSEAAPLPGHSLDTLEEVQAALENGVGERETLPPSLRFAFEGLEAQEECVDFQPVHTNALIPWAEPAQLAEALFKAEGEGFSTCKLKLPRAGWEVAVGVLADFPRLRFRLDANRGMDSSSFSRLLEMLEKSSLLGRIEYIEEPFLGIWEMPAFRKSPLPLAADESAPDQASALRLLEAPNPPSCFVIKPSVLGGLSSLQPFLEKIRVAKKQVIFTSALETEAGRRSLLAYLAQNEAGVAGLCTGFLFRENFLPDQPVYKELPAFSKAERAYLRSLPWRECP